MYRKQVRRRRAVLLLLVAASLTLLSLYYRESNGGPLHGVQDVVSTVFSPIESGADRALKPARDLVNWFGETFDARGDRSHERTRRGGHDVGALTQPLGAAATCELSGELRVLVEP